MAQWRGLVSLRLGGHLVHAAARRSGRGTADRPARGPAGQGWKDAALAGRHAGLARQKPGGQVACYFLRCQHHSALDSLFHFLAERLLLAAALLGLLLFLKVVVGRYDFVTIQSDRL
jgi:hypothetical protein